MLLYAYIVAFEKNWYKWMYYFLLLVVVSIQIIANTIIQIQIEKYLLLFYYKNKGAKLMVAKSNSLQKRITLHRQHFDHPEYRKLPVSSHIPECAKNKDIKFKVFPFYKFYNDNEQFRLIKEKYFITKYKPALNS